LPGFIVRASLKAILLIAFCTALRGRILADGHVHITNRAYWEGIDPWKPQAVDSGERRHA